MAFAVVKGERLRVTRTDRCAKPIEGAANRLVTEAFVRLALNPNMKQREELEQTNAAGKVCVKDGTPPERKWWDVELQVCTADPDLFAILCSWTRILDHAGNPIGMRDRKSVNGDSAAFLEVWSGGEGDDDCAPPEDDSIFTVAASGRQYGYVGFAATEWVLTSGIVVEAGITTFTLAARTVEPKHWGRGPYNVAAINDDGDAGRLLEPAYDKDDDNHLVWFRTSIAPPEPTDGAVALDITGLFVDPIFYFGPDAADVAPEQAASDQGYELTITGGPTGGTFSLNVEYPSGPDIETGTIAFGATPANVKTALVANDDGYTAADWDVTGTTLPGGTITIVPPPGVHVSVEDNNLTGGTVPAPHINPLP